MQDLWGVQLSSILMKQLPMYMKLKFVVCWRLKSCAFRTILIGSNSHLWINKARKNILGTLGSTQFIVFFACPIFCSFTFCKRTFCVHLGGRVEGEGFPTFKQVGVYMRFFKQDFMFNVCEKIRWRQIGHGQEATRKLSLQIVNKWICIWNKKNRVFTPHFNICVYVLTLMQICDFLKLHYMLSITLIITNLEPLLNKDQ
jgi:hypothetical protein